MAFSVRMCQLYFCLERKLKMAVLYFTLKITPALRNRFVLGSPDFYSDRYRESFRPKIAASGSWMKSRLCGCSCFTKFYFQFRFVCLSGSRDGWGRFQSERGGEKKGWPKCRHLRRRGKELMRKRCNSDSVLAQLFEAKQCAHEVSCCPVMSL